MRPPPLPCIPHRTKESQRGAALMVMLVIVVLGIIAALVSSLSSSAIKSARQEKTAAALALAKDALIGDAITYGDTHPIPPANPSHVHGYLPCPDMNGNLSGNPEGSSETCGIMGENTIGRLPWKTLGLSPLRDGDSECLWYAVSGTYKNNPKTDLMNWDVQGFFEILDANGATVAQNVVAVIFAPGVVLSDQNRAASGNAPICGGNYTLLNYLDNDTAAQGNTTAHGINNADITVGKFIQPHYHPPNIPPNAPDITINNQMIFITKDDIFRPIIRRNDFKNQISSLLIDPDFVAIMSEVEVSSDAKGTANLDINCGCAPPKCLSPKSITDANNKTFCNNWKEMLLLTQLPAGQSSIAIGGTLYSPCTRILIFGGQKTAAQVRMSTTDKSSPANYLEGTNLAAFAVPTANATPPFSGALTFNSNNPSTDLLRCLP